ILELYKLATLIHLERHLTNFSGQSAEIEAWSRRAFILLDRLPHSDQPFPLFTISCEARSDFQRSINLKNISQAKSASFSKNLRSIAQMIRSVWMQDDRANTTLNYREKLNAIFSAVEVLPS
ncbi:hypothetical protein BU25DRAFT_310865, partial [Macroventuria anomochaeta]